MTNTIANGRKLVQLLGKVPRIILLILKTNDLSIYRARPILLKSLADFA